MFVYRESERQRKDKKERRIEHARGTHTDIVCICVFICVHARNVSVMENTVVVLGDLDSRVPHVCVCGYASAIVQTYPHTDNNILGVSLSLAHVSQPTNCSQTKYSPGQKPRQSLVAAFFTRMSRKEKYDNSSTRRQQTFMSPEDVAAGKKTNWHGIEITGPWLSPKTIAAGQLTMRFFCCFSSLIPSPGNVRNLSPTLWQFTHLTALYVNDNNLLRLPNDIGLLQSLRMLDLTSNKLRSLPAEIGELVQLR